MTLTLIIITNYIVGWSFAPAHIKNCKYGEKQTLDKIEKFKLFIILITGFIGIMVSFVLYTIYYLVLMFIDLIISSFRELFK